MNLLLAYRNLEVWLGLIARIVLWPSCTFHVGWALFGNSTPVASKNATQQLLNPIFEAHFLPTGGPDNPKNAHVPVIPVRN